jgi:hypothetical protein
MPLTQHELELQAAAVDLIRRELLPSEVPKSIWAFQGTGKLCSLCRKPIDPLEMEYELEAPVGGGTTSTFRFHLRCHAIWQLEVARLAEN